ncbi:structural maintenance of chromosome protein, putative [Plasmodium reichenowi]|uniref:Structural maintenance of chromosome protein, putative n=1 Tax=Plasmodium reichenowi TaxID=5854 RepID=A0A060RZV0_PLARE|nr:structural maintenance of chromosome protein, putative [Plasmodium reichenowi]
MERRGKNQTNDSTLNEFDDDTSEFSMNILNHPNTDVLVSPIKVVDHDFNNFINNKCLDYSVGSSLDITSSNLTTFKSKGQQKINESNQADQNENNNIDEKIKKNTILVNKEEKNKKGDVHLNVNVVHKNVEEENNLTRNKGNFKYTENFSSDNNNHYGSRVIQKSKHTQDYRKDGSYEQEEIKDNEYINIAQSEVQHEDINNVQSIIPHDDSIITPSNHNNLKGDVLIKDKDQSYNNMNMKRYSEFNLKQHDLSISQDYLNNSVLSSVGLYKENDLCFIKYIIVSNFKSYEDENIIGPFSKFTSIIGPNGSGKSNIMDCICFALGINNKYLRVKNLRNLIYHKENEKAEEINKRICYVKIILECNKENVEIKRTLNYKGVSNFFINDKLVDHKEYMNFLRKNRIETKTKTCLIFQGDIEDIINKKPNELAKLFEYISGSDEYEQIYEDIKEKLKEKQINCKNYLNEKKKIEQEMKIHKIQMNDNIEHNKLKENYEYEIKLYYLFKLYHYFKKKEKFKEDLLLYKEESLQFEQDILNQNKKKANILEKNNLIKKKESIKIEEEIKKHYVQINQLKILLNEISEKKTFCNDSLQKFVSNKKLKINMQEHCNKFMENLNLQIKEQNKKLENEYKNKLKINIKFFSKYECVQNIIKTKIEECKMNAHVDQKDHNKSNVHLNKENIKKNDKKGKKNVNINNHDDMKISNEEVSNNYNMMEYYTNMLNFLKDEKILNKIHIDNTNNYENPYENYNIIEFIENIDEYKKCKETYLYLCANSNININNYTNLSCSLKKDIKELQEECDTLNRKKQKELLEYESEKLAYDQLNERIYKLNSIIKEQDDNIQNNKMKIKIWNESILQKEKQIELLEEQTNILNVHKNELISFEKKRDIIKNLKNTFGHDQVFDEVSNLYQVNNQIYYTAVNNVIHKYNNFLVVRNIDIGMKCIKYLKDNKLQKMDFIPYENFVSNLKKKKIKKNNITEEVYTRKDPQQQQQKEGRGGGAAGAVSNDDYGDVYDYNDFQNTEHDTHLGNNKRRISSFNNVDKVINTFKKKNIILANNCLVCDEEYKIMFDYLIGEDTLIVDNIKDAEDIKNKFPYININMVTLNGHVISKNNNLIIDITNKYSDIEKFNNKRLNINLYNKLINEKEECINNINECNRNIIQTNELINKQQSEYELNKKKISSILIKKNIFEKEMEAKNKVMQNYEQKIDKLKNIDLKKKFELLDTYEKELFKERNSLSMYQKDAFKNLNDKLKIDNIYEIIEHNLRDMDKINENINRIKNNIKKLNDDINELLDKKNEMNFLEKNDESINEENIKKELISLEKQEKESNEQIDNIHKILQKLEDDKINIYKNLNNLNQELNQLRDNINTNFEKYEHIENKIENCQKKIQIYTQFINDLINECDINSVNIFLTNNLLKDIDDQVDINQYAQRKNKKENHKNYNNNNNEKKKKKKKKKKKESNDKSKSKKNHMSSDPYQKRKSKLLEDSDSEQEYNTSNSNNTSCNVSEEENDIHEHDEEEQNNILLSNISFDLLSDDLKNMENDKDINNEKENMEKEIERKKKLLKLKNVNCNAEKEYEKLTSKLKSIDVSLSEERKECNLFERNFRILQKKRSYKFLHCFNYIKNIIDNVYNNLTYNAKHHVGGQAFLDLCNFNEFNKDDEPFYCGIKYNNMPPMKRYFEISELSGGEKSISALALIFSIQKYINNSFIILDEVDANMDPLKIQSLTRYLNSINSQVIVISLKEKFFSKSQSLIGVYKNKHKKCSKTITLDISKYRQDLPNN